MAELFRYAAFISYSNSDARFARRLHRALESYGVPASLGKFDLIGGGKTNRIYPVFRDREELSAGDLSERIEAALKASGAVIVVCSPKAAASPWVQKEIEFFLSLGRHDRVFAILPNTAPLADEDGADATPRCFPPAMRASDPANARAFEPLAGDAREGKDGFRNAWLKVVAGLIGVTPGQLIDRDKRRRRERAIAASVGVAAFTLATFGAAAWVDTQTWRTRFTAEAINIASQDRPVEALAFALAGANLGGAIVAARSDRADLILARIGATRLAATFPQAMYVLNGETLLIFSMDRRGTATIYTNGIAHPLGRIRDFHLTPDGALLIISNMDRTAFIYDVRERRAVHDLGRVEGFEVSENGAALVTQRDDGSGYYYDLTNDAARRPLGILGQIEGIELSGDGSAMVMQQADGALRHYDLADGAAGRTLGRFSIADTVALSANGRALVVMDEDGGGAYFDLARGTRLDLGWIRNFVLSENAMALLIQRGNGDVVYYDLASGGRSRVLGNFGDLEDVALSANGVAAVLQADAVSGDSFYFDLADAGPPLSIGGVLSFGLSADGASLVTWGLDDNDTVYDFAQGGATRSLGRLLSFDVAMDRSALVLRTANGAGYYYDLARNASPQALGDLSSIEDTAEGLHFSFGNASAFAARRTDGTSVLYDFAHGGERHYLGDVGKLAGFQSHFDLSASGSTLVTRTDSGDIVVYDLAATRPQSHGGRLAAEVCAASSEAIEPFGAGLRDADQSAQRSSAQEQNLHRALRGRPWHPCDWRGLGAGVEGWAQWWRLTQTRYFGARDYRCEERTADGGADDMSRARCARMRARDRMPVSSE